MSATRMSLGAKLAVDSPEIRVDEVSKALKRRSHANINLHKSIQLLDEAVGSPGGGSLLRSAKKQPGSGLRHTVYTPSKLASGSMFDVTSTFGMTPGKQAFMTPMSATHGSFFSDTITHRGPSGLSNMTQLDASQIDTDVTTTNVGLLLEEDPGLAACTGLFGEFSSSLKQNPSEHQIFQLLDQYEGLCARHEVVLKKLVTRAAPGQSKYTRVVEMLQQLKQEKYTWRLLGLLYRDRIEAEQHQPMDTMSMLGGCQSEKQMINSLFERDATVRQGQLVLDWLEKNASEEFEDFEDKVEFFVDESGPWENTLMALQNRVNGIPFKSDRPIMDKMDPDAPVRQGRGLADLDQDDEAKLLKYIFICIRAGRLTEAQRLCMRSGQPWRAATLEGWRLLHDSNYEKEEERHLIEGNTYRDVWKNVCWKMTEDNRLCVHEKAMYAAFSGNLKQLLPACINWEDYLWAYMRVMIDKRIEQEVRMNTTSPRTMENLPTAYWDKMLNLEASFQEIQACPKESIRAESREKFRLIQKYIILGDIDNLLEEMSEWVRDQQPAHLQRFMAHLVLFLRTIGQATKEEPCEIVLEAYVRDLITDNHKDLVATYTAQLPQPIQLELYAKFLEGIHEPGERELVLALGEEAGLHMAAVTRLVVENIRSQDSLDYSLHHDLPLDVATTQEDLEKISAVDWLVYDPNQRAEAMLQANAIMRTFLGTRKHAAAREVFNKLPTDSIDVIVKNWQMQTGTTELPAEEDNTIREYLCIQAYLAAQDAFNDWFDHFHHAAPVKPEPTSASNFTERVAFEHKQKQYEAEHHRWKNSLMIQSKTTVEKVYNVLLFLDGGWMVDQRHDCDNDETRQCQMRLLRQLCLPNMCFLLHTVLHATGQYREALRLADVIASEENHLYNVFRKDELQKLLNKLRDSSVALLDSNLGPLGYELAN